MDMPDIVVCSLLVNRLVRTRMLGGVGRAAGNGRPYPIWVTESFPLRSNHVFSCHGKEEIN